jgi:starvation-inducible DNA-binding protein
VELGGVALRAVQIVSENSWLTAYPLGLGSRERTRRNTIERIGEVRRSVHAASDTAADAGDAATADFTEGSRDIDKLLWFVEAHFQARE